MEWRGSKQYTSNFAAPGSHDFTLFPLSIFKFGVMNTIRLFRFVDLSVGQDSRVSSYNTDLCASFDMFSFECRSENKELGRVLECGFSELDRESESPISSKASRRVCNSWYELTSNDVYQAVGSRDSLNILHWWPLAADWSCNIFPLQGRKVEFEYVFRDLCKEKFPKKSNTPKNVLSRYLGTFPFWWDMMG